jgi:uroporphyrinogen-III decarboxylase
MPASGYFFDTLVRQEPFDDATLAVEDNLEEFKAVTEEDIAYWADQAGRIKESGKGVIANFGGTALGDIALVPAPFLKYPKGIRDISEWYMSSLMRPDFMKELFERQTDIAVENLKRLYKVVGNAIDVVYMCGNDFGTQQSTFCDPDTFGEIYLPYYRKMNDWIHKNTSWKTFKHSCGAVESLIESFIEAGFDILNPVQVNATGMDPVLLKKKYGDRIVFWGGGIDTQKVLAFGTPDDVKKQTEYLCNIFAENGGFVFNTVHNIQANVPVENVAAMVETLHKLNGSG